jgi:RND family efflux transporter MFP subunit
LRPVEEHILLPELLRGLKRLPVLSLLGAAAWVVVGCSPGPKASDAPASAPLAIEVQVVPARTEQLSTPIRASGTVAALQTSNVTALVEGPVDRVFVRVGDRVTQGQPLLRIRQADYQRQVIEAEAAVRLAEAEVVQTERAFERVRELKDRGFAAVARLDEAEAARDVARARREQARAALATARQSLSDTVLRSPYDGVVTQRMVDEGVFLNSRFSTGGQSAALQLQELRVVAAIVAVPEARVSELRKGQPARLFITGQAEALPSEVFIINNFVDPKARTVEVRLPVRNPGYAISSGVSVVAEIITDPVNAIVVPRRALRGDGANLHLFAVTGDIARRRAVKTADVDLDRVRIIEGVTAGDNVILDPPTTLADGVSVRVRKADAGAKSASGGAQSKR